MERVKVHQNKAASDLYRVVSAGSDENVFLSPFSISTALSMVWGGAANNTELQIRKALALPDDSGALHAGYKKVLNSLQNPPHIILSTANRLYVQNDYPILASYSALLKEKYLAKLKSVDFADASGTAKLINDEVENLTKCKIKGLIDPSALNDLDRAVVINAIYFKGSWKYKFREQSTHKKDFYVSSSSSVKTDMMHMDGKKFKGGTLDELNCKALELPYKGGRFSMLMLLPDDAKSLKTLEDKLAGTTIKSIRKKLRSRKTRVIIPKFRLDTSYQLPDHLETLGISDLFDKDRADLSYISGKNDLFVSKMIHKAFIEVNEEGSEAAAATAVVIVERSLSERPFVFIADHPFFFAIVDDKTELTLFSGRYVKPE